MNLKWSNFFDIKNKKEIKELYIEAFPKEERYPFCIIKKCANNPNVEFYGIYDKEKFVGLSYLLRYEDTIFLFYLAVNKSFRGNGYGAKILSDLLQMYSDKKVILCVERPNKNIQDLKHRRKDFYLRNGFYTTNKFTEDIGVEYEVLCSDKEYVINEKVLKNLFTQMTNKLLLKKLINKIYHIDYVSFIE